MTIELQKLYRHSQRGYFVVLKPTGRYINEVNPDPNSDLWCREVFEFTVREQYPIPIEGEGLIGSNMWVAKDDVNEIFNLT